MECKNAYQEIIANRRSDSFDKEPRRASGTRQKRASTATGEGGGVLWFGRFIQRPRAGMGYIAGGLQGSRKACGKSLLISAKNLSNF
eukprot:jgi/Picre1/28423/NNA_003827.t1